MSSRNESRLNTPKDSRGGSLKAFKESTGEESSDMSGAQSPLRAGAEALAAALRGVAAELRGECPGGRVASKNKQMGRN